MEKLILNRLYQLYWHRIFYSQYPSQLLIWISEISLSGQPHYFNSRCTYLALFSRVLFCL